MLVFKYQYSGFNSVVIMFIFKEVSKYALSLSEVDQKIYTILEFAKEKYELLKRESVKENGVCEDEVELLVIKIDHMRRSGPYVKTLESWSNQLNVTAVLFISSDCGLIFVMEGDKSSTSKFLLNWKTHSIDVDSKGKPCKEKMTQVLYREKVDDIGLLKDFNGRFSVHNCSKLLDFVEGKKIFKILLSVV